MASLNKVMLIGNLGRDPETRYGNDGTAFTSFSIATTDRWKDKNSGEQKERTEWHNIVCAGKLAEIAGEFLKKGKPVYIEGKIQTRKWQDKDGNDRFTVEIRADSLQFLGSREGGGSTEEERPARAARQPSKPAAKPQAQQSVIPDDDDIPF